MAKNGRPSEYTEAIADTICERLADGESLRSICKSEGLPSKTTVFRWIRANEQFRDQYARARETQADVLVDEIIEIADDGSNDWMERKFGEETRWVENGEAMRRSQIRIDARKWFASKVKPKVYGDKIVQEQTGPDGGAIQHVHKIERAIVRSKD